MAFRFMGNTGTRWSRPLVRLLAFMLLMGAASFAQAQSVNCSDFGGVLDGSQPGAVNPSQLTIDVDVCIVRNYPASTYPPPIGFGANLQFQPGQQKLVIFDNVYWSGNIACNAVQQHKIWFVNGAVHQVRDGCQNVLIPVESINKAGPQYAAVGVPFTYRLLIPVLIDSQTGTVVLNGASQNDLHGITLYDNIGAGPVTVNLNGPDDGDPLTPPLVLPTTIPGTGVDLSLMGTPSVRWCADLSCAALGAAVNPTFTNVNGLLKFEFPGGFIIPQGDRIAIDVTVVLNNTPTNALGTQFVNTAIWQFGRLIDGTFYTPLPGENGASAPTTIAGPNLFVEKTGTAILGGDSLNLGEWGDFVITAANGGQFNAWNVTLLDQLPSGPSGGMCDMTPQVYAVMLAGTPLTQDVHYSLSYTGSPTCQLSLTLLDAAGPITPGQVLQVQYRTKLDPDTQNGATMTNVAGATRWFNDSSSNPLRIEVSDPITNGTPGTLDNEDNHTLAVVLSGFFYEKSARNLTSGQDPALIARPGETLQYTLRLQTTDTGFTDVIFRDQLPADFVPGSLVFTQLPPGVTNNSNAATGLIDLRGIDVPAASQVVATFNVTLLPTLAHNHIVENQAELLNSAQGFVANSDDPNVDGQADPAMAGDEQSTRVRIFSPPVAPTKALLAPAGGEVTIGEEITYRITLPGAPRNAAMHDVELTDVLDARLEYVGATVTIGGVVNGPGVVNSSTPSQLNVAIDQIGAGQVALVDLRVRVRNVLAAQQGGVVNNTASFTYSESDGGAREPALSTNAVSVRIIEPTLTLAKAADRTTAVADDIIRYTLTLTAASGADASAAFDISLTDSLSAGLLYEGNPVVTGTGNSIGAPTVTGDGSSGSPQTLTWSFAGGNADIDIAEGESIQVSYDVRVPGTVQADQSLVNSAVARWTGIDGENAGERTGADGAGLLNDYVTAPASTLVVTPGARPSKTLTAPSTPYAAIGQELVYTILVPSAPSSSVLYDVAITDALDASLEYVSATVNGVAGAVNSSTATQMNIAFPQIPAGQQATIELHARVRNVQAAQRGVVVSNTAAYTYATSPGGAAGVPLTSQPVTFTIAEPGVTVAKTGNVTAVTGGDTVRYTVTLTAAAGADASEVFDAALIDTLAPGLVYAGNPVVSGAGNTIGAPVINGDGSPGSPQRLLWSLADANADIDIAPGTAVTVSYDVSVLDGLAALQGLANSVYVHWTSVDGGSSDERTGAGCAAITQPDDYCAGPASHTVVTDPPQMTFYKTVPSGGTANPGDVVRYRLQLVNQSNVTFSGFSIVDELDGLNDPAMFVPGTLTLASVLPAGATDSSNAAGGSRGTGLLDIRNLALGAAGSPTDSIVLEFTAQLVPVIANGTTVLNQGRISYAGTVIQQSDDPDITGDTNPTPITIASAPAFRIEKVSYDVTGDPDLLLAGERLRYSITVKNIGDDNAADARIRDQIPANTTYVPGTTTLNGAAVADAGGTSPLVAGILLNAPEDATPGYLRADASATPSNVATLTFDVTVNANVAGGTVIANQAFVSAIAGGVVDAPSDDPATPVLNDPTRDVVGYQPLLFAAKSATLTTDLGTPGVVDPGDTLAYTITVYNTGTADATGVRLLDQVPVNSTYQADTLTLNGLPVGQPDGGISPLIAGVDISSANLTPPLPAAGLGTISIGESATIRFEVRVNAGVPVGTLITNQASVRSTELPVLLTDGDGNPSTGPEPTVVVVGPAQQLSIVKQVSVVGGGPVLPGVELEYVVRVTNISAVPATYVRTTDDLAAAGPGYLTYVEDSATMDGQTTGITVVGQLIAADFYGTYGPLAPGAATVLRFRARVGNELVAGTRITNAGVVAWNDPPRTATATVAVDVGGITGVGVLSGTIWHDANFNTAPDLAERLLEGWNVELYRNGRLVHVTQTAADGTYSISGVAPNYISLEPLELRFTAPGAGPATAKLGFANSVFTNYLQRISTIVVQPGSNLPNLNLPIEPNGVVYNTMSRVPVPGAVLSLLDAGSRTALPGTCFLDPAQQGQVTLPYGYYRFDLDFTDPSCAGSGYLIDVAPPSDDYLPGISQMIPAASDAATPAFSVPSCPLSANDAVPGTLQRCEVQVSAFAPPLAVRARTTGTTYHLHLALDDSFVPGSSQIFNNHIPLDPDLAEALTISKVTPLLNVTRGQLVPYTIRLRNLAGMPLSEVRLIDRFPAGFRYVPGSARVDDQPVEPVIAGLTLTWDGLVFESTDEHAITLLLAVGAGVGEGEFTNRAQSYNGLTGSALSGEARATVRVVPDPTFDCTDVTGKVFDDINRNGRQDEGERGLAGVRLVSARGLAAITDQYGRYHMTCALTPHEARGSNFVLKLDSRTLPSGFRSSTDQLRIGRATRGKALSMDFGASIHRSVSLNLADEVFEPGATRLRPLWQPRMELLLAELRKSPSVLRLSYLADVEDAQLVEQRLRAMQEAIMAAWRDGSTGYVLEIEPEVFWRRGGPPERPAGSTTGLAR